MTVRISQRLVALLAVLVLAALAWLAVTATSVFSSTTGSADTVAQPIDGPVTNLCKLIPGCENGG
jgi:ABC-type transporter Mla subunit MlaD